MFKFYFQNQKYSVKNICPYPVVAHGGDDGLPVLEPPDRGLRVARGLAPQRDRLVLDYRRVDRVLHNAWRSGAQAWKECIMRDYYHTEEKLRKE